MEKNGILSVGFPTAARHLYWDTNVRRLAHLRGIRPCKRAAGQIPGWLPRRPRHCKDAIGEVAIAGLVIPIRHPVRLHSKSHSKGWRVGAELDGFDGLRIFRSEGSISNRLSPRRCAIIGLINPTRDLSGSFPVFAEAGTFFFPCSCATIPPGATV